LERGLTEGHLSALGICLGDGQSIFGNCKNMLGSIQEAKVQILIVRLPKR